MGRYSFFPRVILVVIALLVLKSLADNAGWAVIPINTLTGAFFGGVFFTISIIFAGAMTDYKEAEKIPGELAVILKALHNDARMLYPQKVEKASVDKLVMNTERLLSVINENFRSNKWHKKNLDIVINQLADDIAVLIAAGASAGILMKMRDNLTAIDRLSHRIDAIQETSFIPSAYAMTELAVAAVLLIFIFAKNEWAFGGIALFSAISFVLIGIILLIRDMDNPFEYGKHTYADVDLSVLFKLETRWQNQQSTTETKPEVSLA